MNSGIVASIYGRPGVHSKILEDNGLTWSDSYPLIGTILTEERENGLSDFESKYCNMISYSNTFIEKLDDDSFLVIYNAMEKFEENAKLYHKAAYVRKIRIAKLNFGTCS